MNAQQFAESIGVDGKKFRRFLRANGQRANKGRTYNFGAITDEQSDLLAARFAKWAVTNGGGSVSVDVEAILGEDNAE